MLPVFNTLINSKGLVQQALSPAWWPYRDPSLQGVHAENRAGSQGPLSASGEGPLHAFSQQRIKIEELQ